MQVQASLFRGLDLWLRIGVCSPDNMEEMPSSYDFSEVPNCSQRDTCV